MNNSLQKFLLDTNTCHWLRRANHLQQKSPSTEGPSLGQYEPLHSSTISYEIFRQNVIIEKVIGKGAFGQVAKGKVKDLRGKQHVTQVAVKMLKGKRLIDHCNQHNDNKLTIMI